MWLVQYTDMRPTHTDEVMSVLKAKGIPYAPIGLIPFSNEIMGIDDLDLSDKVMAYGSCKLVKLIQQLDLKPGVFFDYSSFNTMAWERFLSKRMANSFETYNVETWCLDHLQEASRLKSMFFRPVMDLKTFSGSVKPEGQSIVEFFDEKFNGRDFDDYKHILVASTEPKTIEGEWRCFVVKRALVTASQYRIGGELKPEATTPKGLEAFVEQICLTWLPHENCTVDVAMINGEFKVMEFNCINASGLYKADVEKIVDALNSLMV